MFESHVQSLDELSKIELRILSKVNVNKKLVNYFGATKQAPTILKDQIDLPRVRAG
jgi:hypothetical protein